MKSFLMTASVAALGLALLAVTPTGAAGQPGRPSGSGLSHRGPLGGRHGEFGHRFKANGRFAYGRHGFRSLHWTRYRWDSFYHRYFYWAPSYGWCFYEPTYGYYLPVSYFPEVYPEAAPTLATAISPTPSVIQQTTVVAEPSLPPAPPVVPAPTTVQQTKVVVPTAPAVAEPSLPPAPPVVPAPTAVQQTKVGASVP